ncbi:MAG: Mov34/MPN/PAD-1 family protein [Candidatus Diapherotrites archaeon]|nr:Mov34/MPN/PAD-1 family protein [Candidatus Diapherotrites archaeon]
MAKFSVKKMVVESIIVAARNVYPNEFIALLGGDREKKIVDEIVVLPAVFGEMHSIIRSDLMPFDKRILGSVHSHPSEYAVPSDADLQAFGHFGEINIIIAFPYTLDSMKAFDQKGKKITIEVMA